jgi:hypothetical protein
MTAGVMMMIAAKDGARKRNIDCRGAPICRNVRGS